MTDSNELRPSKEQMLHFYQQMLEIRRTEEQAAKAYTLKKILGFCHLYIGQEAVGVGAIGALNDGDDVVTAYRDHGQIMARGVSAKAMMAELFGKSTGVCHGVGGSMHLVSKEHNFLGGYGIVGAHVPLGVGAAFAAKYLGNDKVSLTFLGDGAAQQGAFYEALAMAQLWKLPSVIIIENNKYAMGTSIERHSYLTDLSTRADGVGMKRWQFKAYDVQEVYANVKKAVDHARSGKGPVLLEAVTYRYRGHSMSDPAKYRAEGELEGHKEELDGIRLAEMALTELHGVSEDTLKEMQQAAKKVAKEAYVFADESPIPDPSHLYDYTYAE